jgi:hypothetical protein
MKSFGLGTYALSGGVAVALLAGCGGSQPPIGAPGAMPQTSATATHADRGKSWMLPSTSSRDLIYATGGCGGACVISYPDGKTVDSITIGGGVVGDCSDSAGNVFITNNNQVLEYAHGGTTPIATLDLSGDNATGCAVDPMTGNLAVVYRGSGADVAVFADAQGQPMLYTSELDSEFCGYDDDGDLFVSGYNSDEPDLSELLNGSGAFSPLSIKGKIGNPGRVQWDGKYLTYESRTAGSVKIARLTVAGSSATVVGTTRFKGGIRNAYEPWIYGNRIIVPYSTRGQYANEIGVWAYPGGGKAIVRTFQKYQKTWSFQAVTLSISAQ